MIGTVIRPIGGNCLGAGCHERTKYKHDATDDDRHRLAASSDFEVPVMQLSPPITILALLAVMVAGTVSLAPPQRQVVQISVMLPTATHQKLANWGRQHASADGRALTVAQVIEAFAGNWTKASEAPAVHSEPRLK